MLICFSLSHSYASTPRETIVAAVMEADEVKKNELILSLASTFSEDVPLLLAAWKEDRIYLYQDENGKVVPVLMNESKDQSGRQTATRIEDGLPLKDNHGQLLTILAEDIETAQHDSNLRSVMKRILDLGDLSSSDSAKRILAISTMGMGQNPDSLPLLMARQSVEKDPRVLASLVEAIDLIQLKNEDTALRLVAIKQLEALHSLASYDFVQSMMNESVEDASTAELFAAARKALKSIDHHRTTINIFGTFFRGLSLGSILLLVAIGLAITFGLMGVINMAHGEIMVVGAYATYLVQTVFGGGLEISPFGFHIFIPGLHLTGNRLDLYFIFALPIAFVSAALVGILLERTVIQFLYRRPLESLLATWGVSLILQQLFRLIFGASNVQVYSPSWLSGNWEINDVILGWNRLFVIGFTVVIVVLVWTILYRTNLGLLIRAVMQNRLMASCLGVRTERVNMLTFGLGSGLAGLAGAFLAQVGNVGPSLGQSYIVDCFMTVVVGGVGSLAGTVVSAVAIGMSDQSLQQYLHNPVLGKILVLVAIIVFLQWRPSGIFVTRSRSLQD